MTQEHNPKSALDQIMASIEELRKDTMASVGHLQAELQENTRTTERLLEGFANGDTDGHRRYHEEVIQAMADKRKLRQELITHLLKTSSWAALIGTCIALATYFKIWIKG